jgi:site-specific DNA-methyltransferase (adenine-specific)
MKIHDVAQLFPMLAGEELKELANDIHQNGLLQPIVMQGDTLLDGRNRLAACKLASVEPFFMQYEGDSPVAFIIAANLKRRHLDKGQKIALGIEIEPYFAEEAKKRQAHGQTAPGRTLVENVPQALPRSRDQAALAVGISGKTLSAAKAIKAKSPEKFEKIKDGKLTIAKAKKEIKAEEDKEALEKAQQEITEEKRNNLKSVCSLYVCSCVELFEKGIRPDAVITDPPYSEGFLPVFTELAVSCAKCGVPLVAVMSGQTYLPEVFKRLCEHLKYRWTLAYLTPGGQSVQQWQAKVNTFWKPVLLFGEASEWIGDVASGRPNDNDKRFHRWGQSESGMADLIERLTKPGQLICDPFLGGGSTAIIALSLGRRFIGCDIDPECVEKTRQRVEASCKM